MVFLIFNLSFLSQNTLSEDQGKIVDGFESPKIGAHCKALLQKRRYVTELKQKATNLKKRAQENIKIDTNKRKTSVKKLEYILLELQNKIRLFSYQIENLNEQIVRNGCPGIVLQDHQRKRSGAFFPSLGAWSKPCRLEKLKKIVIILTLRTGVR